MHDIFARYIWMRYLHPVGSMQNNYQIPATLTGTSTGRTVADTPQCNDRHRQLNHVHKHIMFEAAEFLNYLAQSPNSHLPSSGTMNHPASSSVSNPPRYQRPRFFHGKDKGKVSKECVAHIASIISWRFPPSSIIKNPFISKQNKKQ
jgi:hypothetical protein